MSPLSDTHALALTTGAALTLTAPPVAQTVWLAFATLSVLIATHYDHHHTPSHVDTHTP